MLGKFAKADVFLNRARVFLRMRDPCDRHKTGTDVLSEFHD